MSSLWGIFRTRFAALLLLGALSVAGPIAVLAQEADPSSIPSDPPASSVPPEEEQEPSSIPPSIDPPPSVEIPPSVEVPPSPPEASFPDVAESHPQFAAIRWAHARGVTSGYEDGTFRPEKVVSRAEILKMAYLACSIALDHAGAPSTFPDVASDAWYAPYIAQAEAEGVVHGYTDGRFRPNNTVTRVEALKIAVRACRINHYVAWAKGSLGDTPSGRWFTPYVNLAVSTKIMDAAGDLFDVNGGMRRATVAELLFRMESAVSGGALTKLGSPFVREDGVTVVHASGRGFASFYSDSLAGGGTAAGEKYDPTALTVAHPTLPFNTMVTITNPENGKTVQCRVNDRGPYALKRVLDLSRACFESIERASAGVTEVEWEADIAL